MDPRTLRVYVVAPLFTMMSLALYSCNSGGKDSSLGHIFSSDFVDLETFRTNVQQSLGPLNTADSLFSQQLLKDADGSVNTSYAYSLAGYQPLWMDASGLKASTGTLIEQLRSLHEDGLDTSRYHISALAADIARIKAQKEVPLDSLVAFDKALTRTWLVAARDLLLGTVEMKKGDSLWFARNDTAFTGAAILANALKNGQALPSFDSFRTDAPLYQQMKQALTQWQSLNGDTAYMAAKKSLSATTDKATVMALLKKELPGIAVDESDSSGGLRGWLSAYQYYRQLKATGKLDSSTVASLKKTPAAYIAMIMMNMDRVRALPKDIKGEHLWVTIPLMEVDYFKDDQVLFHGRVVVGKVSRQTPSLWANLTNVVFNPPWGVPPTILRNDVGPGVGRSGAAYLSRKGLRAFDSKGKDVTDQVTAANYKRYSYRQPPGAGNSLGEVKFNLPNPWDIYLHDTPHRENFANTYRALSSGCVRVQNPKALAEIILNNAKFTAEKIDTIIATRKTKFEKLDRRLPVYIIYATIAADSTGSQLRYLNDIYRRDEKMKRLYAGS